MLLGLCGRIGAGKTTIANILCATSWKSQGDTFILNDPEEFVVNLLFNIDRRSTEFHLLSNKLLALMREYIDHEYNYPAAAKIEIPPGLIVDINANSWVEVSFADPLKKVVAVLFDYDYPILLGRDVTSREQREKICTRNYSQCGALSGRVALELFGTEIARNNLGQDIWIDIARRTCCELLNNNVNVVISDIRFENEFNMVNDLGGHIIVVYRAPNDLILTDADKLEHPSRWKFLTFFAKAKNLATLANIDTISTLEKLIHQLIIKLAH